MKPVSLADIARWSGGALIQGVPAETVSQLATDSRRVAPGDLFVALKGERHDAHRFLAQVVEAGPTALLVSDLPAATENFGGGIVRVRDTLAGLQSLARGYRRSLPGLHVVGVTGSNGKTSTKDFLSAVLSTLGPVNATPGNLNNHFGLPLTMLAGDGEERFGVWEMGMNHPGEIEVLAEIAGVDGAVITHIGTAHIEHLGSREAIAAEKAELALAVPAGGYCAMPLRDEYYGYVAERVCCEMVGVGIEEGEVRACDLTTDSEGRARFELFSDCGTSVPVALAVRGRHMVVNALLAAAVGLRAGVSPAVVAEALSAARLTGGRLQERVAGGFRFLDDSYNANPDSMRAALATLMESSAEGRRIAVLGFMGELGEHAPGEHLALGSAAVEAGVDLLVAVGEGASGIHEGAAGRVESRHFPDHESAADYLRGELAPEDLVLVKGSRAAAMERILELLK